MRIPWTLPYPGTQLGDLRPQLRNLGPQRLNQRGLLGNQHPQLSVLSREFRIS